MPETNECTCGFCGGPLPCLTHSVGTSSYCPRCECEPCQCKCDCDIGMCTHRANCRNNPLKISQDEMNTAAKTYRLVNVDKALETNVYEKEIWNAAIEAAATLTHNRGSNQCMRAAIEIRKLKK